MIGDRLPQSTTAQAARLRGQALQADASGQLGAVGRSDAEPSAIPCPTVSDEIANAMGQRLETTMNDLLGDDDEDADGIGHSNQDSGGGASGGGVDVSGTEEPHPPRTTPASLKELLEIVRAELGLGEKLAPKQVLSEVIDFVETKPPKSVVGLRDELEWAVVELLGMARAKELGCCREPKSTRKKSQTSADGHTDDEPPAEFLCPISCELMEDPVTTLAGNTYEKVHIMAWFRTHQTDPLTNAKLSSKRVVPNNLLRSQIHAWMEEHPDADV